MRYQIKGLDCPNCAARLERRLRRHEGLETTVVDFIGESIEIPEDMLEQAERIIAKEEPEARIIRPKREDSRGSSEGAIKAKHLGHSHGPEHQHTHEDECNDDCCHEHDEQHTHEHECDDECCHDHDEHTHGHVCDEECCHEHGEHEHREHSHGGGNGEAVALAESAEHVHDHVHQQGHNDADDNSSSHSHDDSHDHPHTHNHSHEREHDHDRSHTHSHGEEGDEEDKLRIPFMVISVVALLIGTIFNQRLHDTTGSWAEYAVLLTPYLLVGLPVVKAAARNLLRGEFLDENALMTIASIGAIAIHEVPEAAAVMVFYSIGEYLQDLSVRRSRRSIAALMDIRPEYANLSENGTVRRVTPEEINPGDTIIVRPGERVPLDGQVIEGNSDLDTSALTGESVPRSVPMGSAILAGMVNGRGLLTVKVTKSYGQSAVARILELVQNASARKAPTEQFITSFSRYYTPAVVFGAIAVAVLPPLLIPGQSFSDWFYRALVMLVISCPCALVISVPLGYFGGVGGAARRGVLVKGANYLDVLAQTHTVVFDKTGTLTKGVFKVARVVPANGFTEEAVLSIAATAEMHSSHPIAVSIRQAYGKDVNQDEVQEYNDVAGLGVSAVVGGKHVLVGNEGLLEQAHVAYSPCDAEGTIVYVAVDGTFAGCVDIADEIKEDAALAVTRLRKIGISKIVMLTGDRKAVAEKIARTLGLDDFYPELLPEGKVEKVENMKEAMPNPKRDRLVFVGDGINDAPVIARADAGVAMGGLGSDAAIEAADVVLMEDAPSKLATAVNIARWTRRIVKQNIVFSLGVKAVFITLGAFGIASIWEAVFADVGVALLAVANATRALRYNGD